MSEAKKNLLEIGDKVKWSEVPAKTLEQIVQLLKEEEE